MTKEELQKENAILKQNNTDLGEQNEKLRNDFCRVLGFVYYENDYGTRKEKIQLKTWAEIFAKIGELKTRQTILETIERVTSVENNLLALQKMIEKLNPNL